MDAVYFISSVSDVSECFPFIIWILFGRKHGPYALLGIYFLISGILKVATLITAELGIANMPLYHILACLEIVMVYCFYARLRSPKIQYSVVALLILFNLSNSFWLQSIGNFNSIAWTVNMLILLAIGLSHLFQIYNNEADQSPLESRPDFIITSGWLLYASGSLFTYLMSTDLTSGEQEDFFNNAWMFQSITNIAKNMIVSYGLWLTRTASRN